MLLTPVISARKGSSPLRSYVIPARRCVDECHVETREGRLGVITDNISRKKIHPRTWIRSLHAKENHDIGKPAMGMATEMIALAYLNGLACHRREMNRQYPRQPPTIHQNPIQKLNKWLQGVLLCRPCHKRWALRTKGFAMCNCQPNRTQQLTSSFPGAVQLSSLSTTCRCATTASILPAVSDGASGHLFNTAPTAPALRAPSYAIHEWRADNSQIHIPHINSMERSAV